MNCGEIMSRNSEPAGTPMLPRSSSRRRALRSPWLMAKLPLRLGSLIRPFQPTVVRGFSKYTRMMTHRSSLRRSAHLANRPAYSMAASVSWMEQGPTMARSRSSAPLTMAAASWRARVTVSDAFSVMGNSSSTSIAGGMSGRRLEIRRSSVRWNMEWFSSAEVRKSRAVHWQSGCRKAAMLRPIPLTVKAPCG